MKSTLLLAALCPLSLPHPLAQQPILSIQIPSGGRRVLHITGPGVSHDHPVAVSYIISHSGDSLTDLARIIVIEFV